MSVQESSNVILTVDDDPLVSKILERSVGIPSVGISDASQLRDSFTKVQPLAVFLDIYLKGSESGLDLLPDIKLHWPYSPIIVITGEFDDNCLDEAFAKGANDFVLKPIRPREVQARFRTRLTELREKAEKAALVAGDIRLDISHRLLLGPKERQFLAPVETLILAQLIRARGTVLPKEHIKREAWGPVAVSDNAFYRKLFELRKALELVSDSIKVQTVYGNGLTLEVVQKIGFTEQVAV
jgi:DNA-binding response OmpR family regulator